jgi:short-subunit dehydrogenase
VEQELEGSGIGISVLSPGAVRTSIFESAATRPEKFGGPYQRPEQEALRSAFSAASLDPEAVGRRVLRAIRNDEFYVFTHTSERDAVRARHERIRAGFDHADEVNREGW